MVVIVLNEIKGYVIPDELRKGYHFSWVFLSLFFPALIIFWCIVAWRDKSYPELFVAFLFAVIWLLLTLNHRKHRPYIQMKYFCCSEMIANKTQFGEVRHPLTSICFCTTVAIPFYFGKGAHIGESFVVISTEKPDFVDIMPAGLNALRTFQKAGAIILPATSEVTDFLSAHFSYKSIPNCPETTQLG